MSGFANDLKDIEILPERYRNIFNYPCFNIVQSTVFYDIFHTGILFEKYR